MGLALGVSLTPEMAASKTRHNLRVCYDSDTSFGLGLQIRHWGGGSAMTNKGHVHN